MLPIYNENEKKYISEPYLISENKNENEKNDEIGGEIEINNNDENFVKNSEYTPISLKKFFLEKYKISEGRFSRLNLDINDDLNEQKSKKKKVFKNIPKKIIIKVDNHNEKMINNYLNKLKTNKDKE